MFILRFLFKIFYFPIYLLLFRVRLYHENKYEKTRFKNINVIFANNDINVRMHLFFTFFFSKVVFVSKTNHKKFLDRFFLTISLDDKDKLDKYLSKNYKVVFLCDTNNGKIKDIDDEYINFVNKYEKKTITSIYVLNSILSKHRTRINIGKPLLVNTPKNELKKKLNFLNKEIGLYLKYHTYDFFDLSWWFYDLAKIFSVIIIPKIYIFFPIKKLYSKEMTKEDKKIKGHSIIMSNHNTFLDPFLTSFVFFNRRLRYIAALDAMNSKGFLRKTHKYYHSIILDRSKPGADLNMFNETLDVLSANGIVGIFPEGHVVQEGNKLGKFNSGVTLLALTSKSIIYPFVFLKRYKVFSKQYIMIGKPIDISSYLKEDEKLDETTINRLTLVLEEKMKLLQEEGYQIMKEKGYK